MANQHSTDDSAPKQLSLFSEPPIFDEQRIRRGEHEGKTRYSFVDIMREFSDSENEARVYWSQTKKRLKRDGFELYQNVIQLKLPAPDGKLRLTDCADAETCFRIVQSIPSQRRC